MRESRKRRLGQQTHCPQLNAPVAWDGSVNWKKLRAVCIARKNFEKSREQKHQKIDLEEKNEDIFTRNGIADMRTGHRQRPHPELWRRRFYIGRPRRGGPPHHSGRRAE